MSESLRIVSHVHLMEVGMRDGLQSEKTLLTIDQKLTLLDSLVASGIREIDVGSFVNPKAVPQMADTPKVFELLDKKPGVKYRALWLNFRGYEQAAESGKVDLDAKLAVTASETFNLRNTKRTIRESLEEMKEWIERYQRDCVDDWSLTVMSAFGCNFEGHISHEKVITLIDDVFALTAEAGVEVPEVCLADTMGWANPVTVRSLVTAVQERWPEVRVKLHLHDTRGLAVANAMAGLECGVRSFDASLGGIGGCPFAGNAGAAGNICTEDFLFLCREIGVDTGVDLDLAVQSSRLAQEFLQRPLPGKVLNGGVRRKPMVVTQN